MTVIIIIAALIIISVVYPCFIVSGDCSKWERREELKEQDEKERRMFND